MQYHECPWCADDAAGVPTPDGPTDTARLCVWHLAEHGGLTVAELERMDAETEQEAFDALGVFA